MTKNREKKNQKINFSGQNCLKIFEFLTPTKLTKNREKNREQLFLAQNCLNRIMSQLLDNTNNNKKSRKKKIEKLFLGQNFLKQIMSQLLDYTKKLTKIEKNYFRPSE